MNVANLIAAKRDGEVIAAEDLKQLVDGYSSGDIPDYQMSAFAMAVFFNSMTPEETQAFTQAMIDSGQRLDWPSEKPTADKHSTGGIGDKISIPLAPMLACCGVEVPMISGRGLGATGGTLDKLESIPGYRCDLSDDEFRSVVNWNGCAIVSASPSLAPADRKLYALRDVTGTVPSVPMITASILSKKIAAGLDALVLDVKWGSGAFMKTLEQAQELAESLVRIGNAIGPKTTAMITDMNQPLGRMIGNAVEIDESVDVLRGDGPSDVTELTLRLGSQLLVSAGASDSETAARKQLQETIDNGEALERLRQMVKSQGGDLDAKRTVASGHAVTANESGFLHRVNAERLGQAVIEMGGGRRMLGDSLDHSTGIEFLVRIGDRIESDQVIANVFCDSPAAGYAVELVGAAVGIGPDEVDAPELIVETL